MSKEDELAKQIAQIEQLAKENPEVDSTALIKNLMEQNRLQPAIPTGIKARAYIVCLFFPPFGLYYVIKFFFAAEDEGRKQAAICLILTGFSLFLTLWIANGVFSANPELEQIKNLNPQDIRELLN